MKAAKVDHLVLGCSHYPYLIPLISSLLGNGVNIIDSGLAVARQTPRILTQHELRCEQQDPQHLFYTNGNPQVLKRLLADNAAPKQISYKDF